MVLVRNCISQNQGKWQPSKMRLSYGSYRHSNDKRTIAIYLLHFPDKRNANLVFFEIDKDTAFFLLSALGIDGSYCVRICGRAALATTADTRLRTVRCKQIIVLYFKILIRNGPHLKMGYEGVRGREIGKTEREREMWSEKEREETQREERQGEQESPPLAQQ